MTLRELEIGYLAKMAVDWDWAHVAKSAWVEVDFSANPYRTRPRDHVFDFEGMHDQLQAEKDQR